MKYGLLGQPLVMTFPSSARTVAPVSHLRELSEKAKQSSTMMQWNSG